MKNGKKIGIKETRVCNCCGRELPFEEFRNTKYGLSKSCQVCITAKYRDNRLKKWIKQGKGLAVVSRKYKQISPERILRKATSGIELIAKGERFVRQMDYKDLWISNYGRAVKYEKGRYILLRGSLDEQGEVCYRVKKNVYEKNKKRWKWETVSVRACDLVVSTFIVNYDIEHNSCCWHRGGDLKDNYYKNIYPVNPKQYETIKQQFEAMGMDKEETIIEICNDPRYKPENWNAVCMVLSTYGRGYLGCNDADIKNSAAYRKWANMMARAYSTSNHRLKPWYKGCKVCEEWHNYANFRAWYKVHFIDCKYALDKDILVQNNKVYSPETCIPVTQFVNAVFETRHAAGVRYNEKAGNYDVTMSILDKSEKIGTYDTLEAGKQAYIEYKKQYIVDLAEKMHGRGQIPEKLYLAMLKWNVKIVE